MPKTKLDAWAKKPTAMQKKEIIVKKAFAERGIFTQKEMANAAGVSESALSKAFSTKMPEIVVYKLHALLNFTDEQLEELLCAK